MATRRTYLCYRSSKYEAADDVTYTEVYGETLDSASVVIPNVRNTSLLATELKPYSEVQLLVQVSASDNGVYKTEMKENMLIDSIDVAQTSFSGGSAKYCDITIQLMSETKYLEKAQLPNKAFTHSLVSGAKSVYEAAEYLLNAYSPRYIGTSGLTSLLAMDTGVDWTRFKNTPAADVGMAQPTLRQALTTLFTQVGCIPVVKNRKLRYLDLGADRGEFLISGLAPEKMASIRKGMSSDSWVNSLVSESSQCVDYDSSCVMEQLCFRDRDNVLLKQEENLKLETRFPIYSVKKLVLNAYVKGGATFNKVRSYGVDSCIPPIVGSGTAALNVSFASTGTGANIRPQIRVTPFVQSAVRFYCDGYAYFHQTLATVNSDGSLTAKRTIDNSAYVKFDVTAGEGVAQPEVTTSSFLASECSANTVILVAWWFTGTINGVDTSTYNDYYSPNLGFATDSASGLDNAHPHYSGFFDSNTPKESSYGLPSAYWFTKSPSGSLAFRSSMDITPLCVEASKRAQLEVDFLKIPAWSDVDTMSKYLYATVGYSVGGNTIEGFSAKYTKDNGFWQSSKTYIENIMDSIGIAREGVNRYYASCIPQKYWVYMYANQTVSNPFFSSSTSNFFSLLSFDVEYVPLIQSKSSWEKSDVPIPFEQLDSSESGVSSMDAVAACEGEKADRFGNAAYTIHARAELLSLLPSLNTEWSGRVASKRVLKLGRHMIDAEYALAENYVLKNYFTSIVTKYRAYEYVDYDQAVERRELLRAYISISQTTWDNRGLNEFPGTFYVNPAAYTARRLMGALEGSCDDSLKLIGGGYACSSYCSEGELSAVCAGNSVTFTVKEFDNASDGPYVDGTYLTIGGNYKDNPIGGIPQKWYASRGTSVPEIILHSAKLPLTDKGFSTDGDSYVAKKVRRCQEWPRYNYESGFSSAKDFAEEIRLRFPFTEKDAGEVMSYSLQATACWNGGRYYDFERKDLARFSKWLFRYSPLLGGYPDGGTLIMLATSKTSMSWTGAKRNYSVTDDGSYTALDYFWKLSDGTVSDMTVNSLVSGLSAKSAIEVCIYVSGVLYPLAWFSKGLFETKTAIYLSLCPAKTNKVVKEDANSCLYETW